MKRKYRGGRLFLAFSLLLVLCLSPSLAADVVLTDEEWSGIKEQTSVLRSENERLGNLYNEERIDHNETRSLLNEAQTDSETWQNLYNEAETQVTSLTISLRTWKVVGISAIVTVVVTATIAILR